AAGADGGAGAPGPGDKVSQPKPAAWWSRYPGVITEHAQDIVSAAVAATLIILAGGILVAAVVDFFTSSRAMGLEVAATDFLDKVLLVLILVEIVHTVLLALRAHALAAQPFIVVGLVAVIRKILFALGSQQKLSNSTLGIYIGMVAVFVAALVAIEVFGKRRAGPSESEDTIGLH
ncbi:MAG: phosphate-starvation-inducible PsiE family protein, partial [Acidimicrobiales bacterium]